MRPEVALTPLKNSVKPPNIPTKCSAKHTMLRPKAAEKLDSASFLLAVDASDGKPLAMFASWEPSKEQRAFQWRYEVRNAKRAYLVEKRHDKDQEVTNSQQESCWHYNIAANHGWELPTRSRR